MRELVDPDKVRRLLHELGTRARGPGRIYLAGGATALLADWRERSRFIARHGQVDFYHYDLRGQILSKLARSNDRDLADARAMVERGLLTEGDILEAFDQIRERLIRYPALDADTLERRVRRFVGVDHG